MVEKRNKALSTLTDEVKLSADNTLNEIDTTNQTIHDESTKIRLNDEEKVATADGTNQVLIDIVRYQGVREKLNQPL